MSEKPAISVYKITLPITGTCLTINISGDLHYGVRNVSSHSIINSAHKETKQHQDIFRIYTGDMIENALKTSVGHNYDISIPDPQDQKEGMINILKEIMAKQYKLSLSKFDKFKPNMQSYRAVGVCGNHEYRTRKQTGQWLDKDLYEPAKILSMGMQGIVELTIINKKLKLQKTYKLYVAHRPNNSSTGSIEGMLRSFRKKKSDIPGCDAYIFGHYHKRFISSDGYYDLNNSKYNKVLYVVNPSPMCNAEYSDVAGYSPLMVSSHVNIFAPLDLNKPLYGIV